MVVKAKVIEKEWKSASFYTISKLYVVEKEKTKKLIIPNDVDNYEKLENDEQIQMEEIYNRKSKGKNKLNNSYSSNAFSKLKDKIAFIQS